MKLYRKYGLNSESPMRDVEVVLVRLNSELEKERARVAALNDVIVELKRRGVVL